MQNDSVGMETFDYSYIKLNDFINNMSNKHKIIDYEKFKRAGA